MSYGFETKTFNEFSRKREIKFVNFIILSRSLLRVDKFGIPT